MERVGDHRLSREHSIEHHDLDLDGAEEIRHDDIASGLPFIPIALVSSTEILCQKLNDILCRNSVLWCSTLINVVWALKTAGGFARVCVHPSPDGAGHHLDGNCKIPADFPEAHEQEMILCCLLRPQVYRNLQYFVPMPGKHKKDESGKKARLELLKTISGSAVPGQLTALMGGSGAGKVRPLAIAEPVSTAKHLAPCCVQSMFVHLMLAVLIGLACYVGPAVGLLCTRHVREAILHAQTTLMDVIAGRKTQGEIRGEILVNGFPKQQESWARVVGYVEQNDIHSPQVGLEQHFINDMAGSPTAWCPSHFFATDN